MPPALRRRPEFHGSTLAVRARVGGLATQLGYAGAHCVAHLAAAVSLLLLLELVSGGPGGGGCWAGAGAQGVDGRSGARLAGQGKRGMRVAPCRPANHAPPAPARPLARLPAPGQAIEALSRYEGVGRDGYHSL